MTVVSLDNIARSCIQTWDSDSSPCHTSTATQNVLIDRLLALMPISASAPTWLYRFIQSSDSTAYRIYFNVAEWDFMNRKKRDNTLNTSPSKIAFKFKELAKMKRELDEKVYDLQLEAEVRKFSLSGTSLSTQTRDCIRY